MDTNADALILLGFSNSFMMLMQMLMAKVLAMMMLTLMVMTRPMITTMEEMTTTIAN